MNRLLCLLLMAPLTSANMRFASPLQALTIWDDGNNSSDDPIEGPRDLYLKKFQAGLEAENKVRQELKKKHEAFLKAQDTSSPEWAKKAARYERARKAREEKMAEEAYDEAVAQVERQAQVSKRKAPTQYEKNQYQFVGVINEGKKDPISWYAKKKSPNSSWSLRLVHVNRDAIIKDLFARGKVDIFSKYKNKGFKVVDEETDDSSAKKELQVAGEYEVRERSWRTLWNFSPKHFFTDSSGMYWRERRLPPAVYTDGTSVYETTYRYKDGRNGIRRIRKLSQFLQDTSIDKPTKEKLLKRIQKDHPDLVVEG